MVLLSLIVYCFQRDPPSRQPAAKPTTSREANSQPRSRQPTVPTEPATESASTVRPRPEDLYTAPNALAPCYSAFRVDQRLLLSGHSHQAWPDCARDAQLQAFDDAARDVDAKWTRAFEQAARVRRGYAQLLGEASNTNYTLAGNTHDLLVRLLSALPLRQRPRLVTTDGEFHTARRQLRRLEEEGLEVVWVPAQPVDTLAERLATEIQGDPGDRTALVLVSAVLFRTGHVVPGLGDLLRACRQVGAELLVDVYHALGVLPFDLAEQGLEDAFVVGGGYKYLQLGEGNCFLRFPTDRQLRPVVTGWFSEFSALAAPNGDDRVTYGQGGDVFAGATYDPVSHYRGARVFEFFDQHGLTPEFLRQVSLHQVGLLRAEVEALDPAPERLAIVDPELPAEQRGGFLALESPQAETLCRRLRQAGVFCDSRGDILRLGPAPYLCDTQLRDAVAILGDLISGES